MNFPVTALPLAAQQAVHATQSQTGVPVEAIAGTALSIMAFAVQGHYDIRTLWNDQQTIPSSLYTATIFGSGGGKTTIFNLVLGGWNKPLAAEIDKWETAKMAHDVDVEIWEQDRAQIKSDKTLSSDLKRSKLKKHEGVKPVAPPMPDSHFKTFTTAGLFDQLKSVRPSVGFFTSEAGELFKSHSAGSTTGAEIELYTQLTNLYDGAPLKKATLSGGATHIRGRRASAAFLVQAAVAKDFFNHPTLSGQGIHGRILVNNVTDITKPELDLSPAGKLRMDAANARITAFNDAIEYWVKRPLPVNPDDPYQLEPDILEWDNASNANPIVAWYNGVARKRDQYDHPGVEAFLSRQFENASRIAGVIAAFKREDRISDQSASCAVEIMEFYVDERINLDLGQAASKLNDLVTPTRYLEQFFAKQKTKGRTDFTLRELKQYATASSFRDLNPDVQIKVLNGMVATGVLNADNPTRGTRTVTEYHYIL